MESQKHLAFVQGFGFGGLIGVLIGITITNWAFYTASNQKPTPSFEEVGNYKNCKVVQFSPYTGSSPNYFLDCSTSK